MKSLHSSSNNAFFKHDVYTAFFKLLFFNISNIVDLPLPSIPNKIMSLPRNFSRTFKGSKWHSSEENERVSEMWATDVDFLSCGTTL